MWEIFKKSEIVIGLLHIIVYKYQVKLTAIDEDERDNFDESNKIKTILDEDERDNFDESNRIITILECFSSDWNEFDQKEHNSEQITGITGLRTSILQKLRKYKTGKTLMCELWISQRRRNEIKSSGAIFQKMFMGPIKLF